MYTLKRNLTLNLRFPGQYYDAGTNQFYNHNRFYNPELGRYMEPDPIGLEGGLNPYNYCYQNPIMYVDPNGESPVLIGALLGFGSYTAPLAYRSLKEKGSFTKNFKKNWDTGAAITSTVAGAVTGGVSSSILKSTGLTLDRSKHFITEASPFAHSVHTYLGNLISKLPLKN